MYYKNVLIIENSTNGLKKLNESIAPSGKKQYILGGIFTEFNVKNRNDRIYQADRFLPHLDELLERKKTLGVIYGEFDHPDVFDTSLSRVSHTVEKCFFVREKNRVDGEIRLLNTHWGREAQALIDDGCPIFVSSRAAGVTESNGEVTIKKLFTYDAVADPGFSSAKMELRTLNESLGFNESANFRIYDISDESKINELFNMDKNEFVTKEQMEKYSNYLTEQITKTKSEINEAIQKGDFDPAKLSDLYDKYDSFQEGFKKIASYLDYLAETMQVLVQENKKIKKTNEKLEGKLDRTKAKTEKIIEHNDYLAGELEKAIGYTEKAIGYTEYVAEAVDKSIDYSNYIAETLDKSIDFSEYIAENVDNTIKYSEYIAENLDKSIDYSEYVAENLEKNIAYAEYIAEHVDNNIKYAEYIAEHVDNNIKYAEYIAEHVDNSIKYTEYVGEQLDNSIKYSEYIAENLTDSIAYGNYLAEAIDKNVEYGKYLAEKLNSGSFGRLNEQVQPPAQKMGNFKTDSVAKYYDENENDMTQAQPVQGAQAQGAQPRMAQPVQGQAQPRAQAQAQQVQGMDLEGEESEDMDVQGVNAEEIQDIDDKAELTPGQVVKIDDDKTGEILAVNADNGIAVVKLSDTGEVQEIQESRLSIIGDKIYESENTLKKLILKQINESKKREASKDNEPHFLLFLTEKKKAAYYNLSQQDKEKVIVAMNESKGYTTESEVLAIMAKALTTATRSFNETLIDNIPGDLRPIWESLRPEVQGSIINSAQFYTNLTEDKMESFWNSRDLHKYAKKNMGKVTLLTESNNKFDNTKLSDDLVDAYLKRINQR
jgi:regulator of replication initiation timing